MGHKPKTKAHNPIRNGRVFLCEFIMHADLFRSILIGTCQIKYASQDPEVESCDQDLQLQDVF